MARGGGVAMPRNDLLILGDGLLAVQMLRATRTVSEVLLPRKPNAERRLEDAGSTLKAEL
jgi:hypothetical protein